VSGSSFPGDGKASQHSVIESIGGEVTPLADDAVEERSNRVLGLHHRIDMSMPFSHGGFPASAFMDLVCGAD
jgi:hypothetical protein